MGLKAAQTQPKTWEEMDALRKEVQASFPKYEKTLENYSLICWFSFAEQGRTPEEAEALFPKAMGVRNYILAREFVLISNVSNVEKAKRMCEICFMSNISTVAKHNLSYTLTLLPELPVAEAKAALQKMNRIWSSKLISEKGKGWEEVVAMVRTTLETY